MPRDPALRSMERAHPEPKAVDSTFHFARQESGALQDTEVLRGGGLRDVKRRSQLARGELSFSREKRQHPSPRTVAEGVKRPIEPLSIIYRHVAIY
jgi:hypothetical protein